MPAIFLMLLAMFGLTAFILFIIYVFVPLIAVLSKLIGRTFTFIGGELGDVIRIIGAVITSIVFVPMALGSIVIGRWSASKHYFGAVRDEIAAPLVHAAIAIVVLTVVADLLGPGVHRGVRVVAVVAAASRVAPHRATV